MSEQLFEDSPDLTLEVAFGSNPFDPTASVIWTDITDRVRGGSTRKGRDRDLDQFEAGALRVLLDNRDRALDSEFHYSRAIVAAKPRLYYRMKETLGTVAFDEMAHKDAAYVNTPLLGVAGKVDTAVDFNGVDEYVEIPDTVFLDVLTTWTVEAWINIDALPGTKATIYSRDQTAGVDDPQVSVDSTGRIRFDGVGGTFTSSVVVTVAGGWYHVVVAFDDVGVPELTFFVNGVNVGTGTPTTPPTVDTLPGYVGRSSAGEYFDGQIQHFALYDRTMGAAEALEHYQAGLLVSPFFPNVQPMKRIRLAAEYHLLIDQDRDFESALLGTGTWEADAGLPNTTLARSTAQAKAGVASLATTKTVSTGTVYVHPDDAQAKRATPGRTYRMRAHVRAATTVRACTGYVLFMNAALTVIGSAIGATANDNSSQWTLFTAEGIAPAGTIYAIPAVGVAAVPVGEVHYIDSVALFGVGDMFDGFVDGWPNTYEGGADSDAVVELEASDAFKVFGSIDLPASPFALQMEQYGPQRWYRFAEKDDGSLFVGTDDKPVAFDSSETDPKPGTYYGLTLPEFGVESLTAFDSDDSAVRFTPADKHHVRVPEWGFPINQSEVFVFSTTSPNGHLFAKPNANRQVAIQNGVIVFGVSPSAYSASSVRVDDGLPHVVVCGSTTSPDKVWVDGVDVTVFGPALTALPSGPGPIYGASSPTANFFDGVLCEVAHFSVARTPDQIVAISSAALSGWRGDRSDQRIGRLLDFIGWPIDLRDFDVGSTILQGQTLGDTLLSALQQIQETERGLLYMTGDGKVRMVARHAMHNAPYTASQAVFGDDPTQNEVPYAVAPGPTIQFDDVNILNDVTVQREGGTAQRARDMSSITRFGVRGFAIGGLQESDLETADAAHYIVNNQAEPQVELTRLPLNPRSSPTVLWPLALGLEIGELITVKRRPPGDGGPITKLVRVQGIEHVFSVEGDWATILRTWRADLTEYWLLGVNLMSNLGETTTLGY